MKRIKITVLLILLCVLAGCSPKDTSLRAYCTESQQEFLDQSLEELPVALTYHHNDNILGRYETTDEEIISEILQALRETTIVSKAFSGSTDSRILEFETADGDTCLFWFDENRFHGAGGTSYVLSGDEEIWDLARKIQETYPEYRGAMEEKRHIAKPGIPYLYPAKAVQAVNAWFIYTHFSNARDSDLASFILFPCHNGHCDVFHGFSHFGVPDNKMNRRRFFLGHDRPASLMDKNLDMAERRRFVFLNMVVFMHLRKALHLQTVVGSGGINIPGELHQLIRFIVL